MTQRKLIRPKLSEIKEKQQKLTKGKKPTPPGQTFAEIYYFQKQMHNKTPMVVVLLDGEKIYGQIDWWDQNAIKISRKNEPNVVIQKHAIKYIYKDEKAIQEKKEENQKEVKAKEEEKQKEVKAKEAERQKEKKENGA
jgi:sRNA-binding regulator protein Hfq